MVSGGDDKTVRLWDAAEGAQLATFYEHSECVSLPPHSAPRGAGSGATSHASPARRSIIHTARFGPDGTCVAAAAQDGSVNLWDVRSHRLIQHYDAHAGPVTSMRFHPSGSFLYTASEDGTSKVRAAQRRWAYGECVVAYWELLPLCPFLPQVWDLREGHLLYTIEGHGAVRALGSTVGGAHFATGGDDSLVMVWNARFAKQFPAVGRATAAAEAREKELFSSPGEGAETGKGRSRRGRAGQKASATRPTSRPRSGSRTGPSKEQGALAVGEGDTMGAWRAAVPSLRGQAGTRTRSWTLTYATAPADYLPGGDISSRGLPGVSRKSPPPAHELRGDAPVVPAPAAREVAQEPSRERSEGAGASSVRARDSEGTVAKDAAVMMMERLMEQVRTAVVHSQAAGAVAEWAALLRCPTRGLRQMETLTQTVSLLDSRLANQEDRVEEVRCARPCPCRPAPPDSRGFDPAVPPPP